MIIRSAPTAALAFALTASALIGCKSNSNKSATPSIPPFVQTILAGVSDSTPGATPSVPAQAHAIRTIDLEHSAPVQQAVASTGGQYVQSSVIYADLTGDGSDDAVVPISSGGTMGDMTYIVLTPSDSGVTQLFAAPSDPQAPGGVAVSVTDGKLVETRPIYGPTDPNCCPSQLRTTTYAWDGTKFVQESTSTAPNPAGGVKPTPTAAASR